MPEQIANLRLTHDGKAWRLEWDQFGARAPRAFIKHITPEHAAIIQVRGYIIASDLSDLGTKCPLWSAL